MGSIEQLHESLASLKSYQLPSQYELFQSKYKHDRNSDENKNPNIVVEHIEPILDPKTIQRYRKARDTYLRTRITDQFLEYLGTVELNNSIQGDNNTSTSNSSKQQQQQHLLTFQYPPPPSPQEQEQLRAMGESFKRELSKKVHQVKTSYENVQSKYEQLNQKREELERIVNDLAQRKKIKSGGKDLTMDNTMDDGDIDDLRAYDERNDEIDNAELALEEEKLRSLQNKRSTLEARLRRLRMEKEDVSSRINENKKIITDIIQIRESTGNVQGNNSSTTTLSSLIHSLESKSSLSALELENEELRERAVELKQVSEYYNSMTKFIGELGGMKILSITNGSADSVEGNSNNDVSMSSSPQKSPSKNGGSRRRRISSPSNNTSPKQARDSICIKVLLLDKHVILVTLSSTTNHSDCHSMESFRVTNAKLLTSNVLTYSLPPDHDDFPSSTTNSSSSTTISLTIPPLDDLVSIASNLEPIYDLRFVLREASSRIRSLTSRLDELVQLRLKYLTKIVKMSKASVNRLNYGFGGEDQEVVCSLNQGISVVLRLTADCPLLEGSVYIHQIVGVCGWDDALIQRIKVRLNERKYCRPIDIMDGLVEEIGRIEEEGDMALPGTPTFPRRNF